MTMLTEIGSWRRLAKPLTVAVASLFLAMCSPSGDDDSGTDQQTGADAGKIVFHRGNSAEPSTLDPHRASGTWENNIIGDMFVGLYTENAQGEAIEGMATSHEVSDDGLIHTFTLRDAVWSDGEPVTAEDFVFSFRRILNPETAAQYASILYIVKNAQQVNNGELPVEEVGIRAIDEKTLEITLESPAPFLEQLLTHYTSYAVPKHVVEELGDDWVKAGNMVSNGPFVLVEWDPNNYVHVKKNDRFYDAENVEIDEVYYYPTTDAAVAVRRVRNGELDYNSDWPVSQGSRLRSELGEIVQSAPFVATTYIIFNMEDELFGSRGDEAQQERARKIRKALALLIDREIIVEKIFGNGETAAYHLVPPNMANYDNAAEFEFRDLSMPERIEMAKGLLRELGYSEENPLRFEWEYRDGTDNRRRAVAVQQMWNSSELVEAEIINREVKTLYANLRSGNFRVGDAGWVADYNDAQNYLFLLESRSGQLNYGKYNNPEYDRLMAEAANELDLEKRADLLAQAEQIMLNDYPMIPVMFGASRNLVGEQVSGFENNIVDIHRTRWMSIDPAKRP